MEHLYACLKVQLLPRKLLRLNCGIDSVDVAEWSIAAEGSRTDMTSAGVLLPSFEPYFYIDPAGKYDLVARTSNANESYCGTYTCTEFSTSDTRTATVANKSVYNTSPCSTRKNECLCFHTQ